MLGLKNIKRSVSDYQSLIRMVCLLLTVSLSLLKALGTIKWLITEKSEKMKKRKKIPHTSS